ncbi:hypothetical protein [Desulfosporosinus sp. SB140]|uniref:hypothetical protein n=1 Tax=Desulfosporosinus paludis TaxID=3115649 RepID=UPI00388FFC46
MDPEEFWMWVDYVHEIYGKDVAWPCSKQYYREAFRGLTFAKLKTATDMLYKSNTITYVANDRKQARWLVALLPTINKFEIALTLITE